ncbi:MAG: biopolymer transporter ExbD [Saprospiraceae bacterium]|nr:biopolymer transporter ExbD [Saprospiraceae bacterium]
MRWKKKKRESPEVSTASLPDIIFMLLFFFMTVTVLKTASAKMTIELPATEQSVKVNHEASEYNIYVSSNKKEEDHKIQINEYLVTMHQLDDILKNIASPLLDFEKLKVPIYLRVDKEVQMDLVYDVKLLLRKHGLRKINYIVKKQSN